MCPPATPLPDEFFQEYGRCFQDLVLPYIIIPPSIRLHGLTFLETFLLNDLNEAQELSQKDIRQRYFLLSQDQISRLISSLVKQGYAERSRQDDDRRAKTIAITAEGRREAFVRQQATLRHNRDDLMSTLSPEDMQAMLQAVKTILDIRTRMTDQQEQLLANIDDNDVPQVPRQWEEHYQDVQKEFKDHSFGEHDG